MKSRISYYLKKIREIRIVHFDRGDIDVGTIRFTEESVSMGYRLKFDTNDILSAGRYFYYRLRQSSVSSRRLIWLWNIRILFHSALHTEVNSKDIRSVDLKSFHEQILLLNYFYHCISSKFFEVLRSSSLDQSHRGHSKIVWVNIFLVSVKRRSESIWILIKLRTWSLSSVLLSGILDTSIIQNRDRYTCKFNDFEKDRK